MKVVLINKSDRRGGAAVVTSRLLDALRAEGVDARMLVAEKLGDSPYVEVCAPGWKLKEEFLAERLNIFLANGLSRKTLFQIDTGAKGVAVSRHPLVREADAVLLNWVNQGMVSLDEVGRLAREGKKMVWTMHDLWCMTGICHHTSGCDRYTKSCGRCHLLGRMKRDNDLSRRVMAHKHALYSGADIHFVAVSNWLGGKAAGSSLLSDMPVSVIPNAFPLNADAERISAMTRVGEDGNGKLRILMGAARLDDPVKWLPAFREATKVLASRWPGLAGRAQVVTFGGVKDPSQLEGFGITHTHLGTVDGDKALAELYGTAAAVVSTSHYETLPGTLIEGQAYGAIPVSLDRGGQPDIIEHRETGYLAEYSPELNVAAFRIAEGLHWALENVGPEIRGRMHRSVRERFGARSVARKYIRLLERM